MQNYKNVKIILFYVLCYLLFLEYSYIYHAYSCMYVCMSVSIYLFHYVLNRSLKKINSNKENYKTGSS